MDYPFPNLNSFVSGRFESNFTFWTWFDSLVAEVFLVKLHSGKCHWPSLMPSQHWFRWWLTTRQQATTWAKVDPDFCCHVAPLGKNGAAWKIHYGMEKIYLFIFLSCSLLQDMPLWSDASPRRSWDMLYAAKLSVFVTMLLPGKYPPGCMIAERIGMAVPRPWSQVWCSRWFRKPMRLSKLVQSLVMLTPLQ